jgi:hypothetical protein
VLYSNPPKHGAALARMVLEDDELRDLWVQRWPEQKAHWRFQPPVGPSRSRISPAKYSRGVQAAFQVSGWTCLSETPPEVAMLSANPPVPRRVRGRA